MANTPRLAVPVEGSTLIVAEVGQAHDGSLGTAHAFIDAVADSGAGAIKFQTHIADAESTRDEPWRVKFSQQDRSRFDYWKRMEFSKEQWRELSDHACESGLLFMSSAFSIEAVELLCDIGVPAWKVASGEITNRPMLDAMVSTGKPLLVSTGMSSWRELDEIVAYLHEAGSEFVMLQCTSSYPCTPEQIGLNVLSQMKGRYNCSVGLSDHSGTIFPSLAAIVLGASVIEVHVTLSRRMFGPDVPASLTIEELTQLARGVSFLTSTLSHPVEKDSVAEAMIPMRHLFTKSVVPRRDLPRGTILSRDDLACKKPGSGIPVAKFESLVGRTVVRDLRRDELFGCEDLSPL